jgi:hypothetical protein
MGTGGEEMTFVELLGNSPQVKLLDFLGDHIGSYYTWQEITKHVISIKQNRAAMNRLINAGLMKKVDVKGKICYMINDTNDLVRAVIHSDFEKGKKAAEKEAKK